MQVSRYFINSAKISALKIALVSDVHDRDFGAVQSSLSEEEPDIIALAGDITNKRMSGNFAAEKVFRSCAEIAPSFFCPGNHEYAFAASDRKACEEAGVCFLDDEFVSREGVFIGGLRSGCRGEKCRRSSVSPEPRTEWLTAFDRQNGFKILLSHHPEYYTRYIRHLDIDLILSGHAHGGQIRLFNRGLFSPNQGFFPEYTKGVYDGRLVVGTGLSNTAGIIPRFNNPAELVMIKITGSRDRK